MRNALETINKRIENAASIYGPMASTHEALGVLLEEFAELRDAIHANDEDEVYSEACDVAAVAIRLAETIASELPNFRKRSGFKG